MYGGNEMRDGATSARRRDRELNSRPFSLKLRKPIEDFWHNFRESYRYIAQKTRELRAPHSQKSSRAFGSRALRAWRNPRRALGSANSWNPSSVGSLICLATAGLDYGGAALVGVSTESKPRLRTALCTDSSVSVRTRCLP
jgi:hypothetical protein